MSLSIHKAKPFSLFVNVIFVILIFCIILSYHSSDFNFRQKGFKGIENYTSDDDNKGCKGIHLYDDNNNKAKCEYAKSHKGCQPEGYIPYLQLFYCSFSPILGYILLVTWLVVLFYLLGDTASSFFCSSLEGLSTCLKLSPTVAGVTLLSLGNGAPDVFDSIISFIGDENTKDIGLNSILGGAFFVSSVVVGVISISASNQGRKISYSSSFTWNIILLLLCLSCLLVIIIIGKINLWGSLGFLSLYFIYVAFIFVSEVYACKERNSTEIIKKSPALPITIKSSPDDDEESEDLHLPLLNSAIDECLDLENGQKGQLQKQEKTDTTGEFWVHHPHCTKSQYDCHVCKSKKTKWYQMHFSASYWFRGIIYILGLPLDLPRKLTIPIISEEKWSKPFAVVSTLLAPILLAVIWYCHYPKPKLQFYIIGVSIGVMSGVLLFCISDSNSPPRKFRFLWLSESFLMSITWTYLLAQELISLMVCLGMILKISNSVMGLTVLAWGNSLGDLFSNVTMARNGGPGGSHIAISGCYAGPIFNIVVGLGLSFCFSSWAVYPSSVSIVSDPSLYVTVGFLMVGLLWALLVGAKKMELDKLMGSGLLIIYCGFLILKALDLLETFSVQPSHYIQRN